MTFVIDDLIEVIQAVNVSQIGNRHWGTVPTTDLSEFDTNMDKLLSQLLEDADVADTENSDSDTIEYSDDTLEYDSSDSGKTANPFVNTYRHIRVVNNDIHNMPSITY